MTGATTSIGKDVRQDVYTFYTNSHKWILLIWMRNQGGGADLYETRFYASKTANTTSGDCLGSFLSTDWTIGSCCTWLDAGTYYFSIQHTSNQAHIIDFRIHAIAVDQ